MERKILLVDDEEAVLKVTKARLEHEGFKVLTAKNGVEAMSIAFSEENLSLFLLDIRMPKLDGYQLTQKLKEHPMTARIPIILFTASVWRVDDVVARCFELGIADVLYKPFRSKQLLEVVHRVLNIRETKIS